MAVQERRSSHQSISIQQGQSASNPIEVWFAVAGGIALPDTLDGTSYYFEVSTDGVTYQPLRS